MGITPEEFVSRFGAPMPPRAFGDHVISILKEPQFAESMVLGLNGNDGVTVIDL